MDLQKVRNHYRDLDDLKIELLAKNDASALSSEVLEILIEEIERRKLNPLLIESINAQAKGLSIDEFQELSIRISNLACPECKHKEGKLVGSKIRTTIGYILIATTKEQHVITCEKCADERKTKSKAITLAFGWLGLISGVYFTIRNLYKSYRDNQKLEEVSNAVFQEFVIRYFGDIAMTSNRDDELLKLIHHFNRQ